MAQQYQNGGSYPGSNVTAVETRADGLTHFTTNDGQPPGPPAAMGYGPQEGPYRVYGPSDPSQPLGSFANPFPYGHPHPPPQASHPSANPPPYEATDPALTHAAVAQHNARNSNQAPGEYSQSPAGRLPAPRPPLAPLRFCSLCGTVPVFREQAGTCYCNRCWDLTRGRQG